ncbi:cupredoxin family copper-binding protein [Lentzea sp. NPDC006480]|uniref:cupredoxin domain-containing protein n=1 Tax=Lentzea sp. NPDC006480 TaxID=3157176 RepID=UPI0033B67748
MKRGLAGVVLAAFAVLTSSSWVSTAAAAETHQIPIARYAYVPATMTVHVGDVVTWTNQDEASHDVAGGTFRSPMLATGQWWSFTFTQPGTFDYVCSVHPDMRAQIVVLAQETTAAPPPPVPQPVVQQPEQTTPVATSAPETTAGTTAPSNISAVAAPPAPPPVLPPMLLLAGLVAAVTTLCLLVIGSRPDRAG